MRELGYRPDALIEVLHTAQEAFGYLDAQALAYVGDRLGVPQSKAYGVATFYSYFTLEPEASHSCVVCTGTACYLDGAGALVSAVAGLLAARGQEAAPDRWLSLEEVRCLGPCSMAPVAVVDHEVHGKLTPPGLVSVVESL
jgi:bidirectional [NiFe] hydrogenase diaphorase subunit